MIMQRKIAAEVEQGRPEDVLEAQAAEVANGGNIAKEMILQTVDLDLDRALDQLEEDLPEIGIATDREKDKDSVESVKEKENMKEVYKFILLSLYIQYDKQLNKQWFGSNFLRLVKICICKQCSR